MNPIHVAVPVREHEKFPWGMITNVHKIGPYEIYQYQSNSDSDRGAVLFHAFYYDHEKKRWVDTYCSCQSLEGSIISAISHRSGYDRTSSSASHFIGKMLDLDNLAGIEYFEE